MKQSESTSRKGQSAPSHIPETVQEAVRLVAVCMGGWDDWVDIKIQVMNSVNPDQRRLFSRRDQKTREQVPNDFDRAVMRLYEDVSGVTPVVRTLRERRELRSGVADDRDDS